MNTLDVGITTETTHPMPKHAREISEAKLALPPERRGKHSAAFLPESSSVAVPAPSPTNPQRIPKHSKAFAGEDSPAQKRPTQEAPKAQTARLHSAAPKKRLASQHCEALVNTTHWPAANPIGRWVNSAKRQFGKKPRVWWARTAGVSLCGLMLVGGIGTAAGLALQNTLGGDWAIAANAESADETLADQSLDEAVETPLEDTSSLGATSDESLTVEERFALLSSQPLQNAELGSLPADTNPFAFVAASGETFALSPDAQTQLAGALEPFTAAGYSAGYLLVDIETGRGIAANLDQQVYGASAIKAPFVLYMLETAFPTGAINFDTPFSEDVAWDSMDGDLTLDEISLYPFMTLAESSITTSDNDAFRIIRANYESPDFRVWLDGLGLQSVDASEWFPYLSARDLGKLWLEMYNFWETETEEAWWLETHCSLTEMSFVRAALMSQGLYPDIVVADKAGWINGWDPGYHCLTDGSLVTYNGRTYLLCAVTDAPYDEYWESYFETLIATLFAAREELA